jgi:hypothetical protein
MQAVAVLRRKWPCIVVIIFALVVIVTAVDNASYYFATQARERMQQESGTVEDEKKFRNWLTYLVLVKRLNKEVKRFDSQPELYGFVTELRANTKVFYWESVEYSGLVEVYYILR